MDAIFAFFAGAVIGLGSPQYSSRQWCERILDYSWPLSAPALVRGVRSLDAETAARCRRVIDRRSGRWRYWAAAYLVHGDLRIDGLAAPGDWGCGVAMAQEGQLFDRLEALPLQDKLCLLAACNSWAGARIQWHPPYDRGVFAAEVNMLRFAVHGAGAWCFVDNRANLAPTYRRMPREILP